jgi:regulatory protein YycI of two-component signal transduction system YycFG
LKQSERKVTAMDWSRAKTILLISFLLLNLLLGYQLWYDKVSPTSNNSDAVEATPEIEQTMAKKNIVLNAKVSRETPKLREIEVKITPGDGEPPVVTMATPFQASELKDRTSSKNALSKRVPDGESYQLDNYDSRGSIHVLHQMQGLYPMFDVKLELYEVDGVIQTFKQMHAEVLAGAVVKEEKVLAGFTVIELLVEKYLKDGSNIIDVRLGYHGQAFDAETRVLAPYWRVVTSQGDRFFVHAITGAVEE